MMGGAQSTGSWLEGQCIHVIMVTVQTLNGCMKACTKNHIPYKGSDRSHVVVPRAQQFV